MRTIDGNFGPVYHSNENGILEYQNIKFDVNTPDEILAQHNLFFFEEGPGPEFPNLPKDIHGPKFKIKEDGTRTVIQYFDYIYHTRDVIVENIIQELYFQKDHFLRNGIEHNGNRFDLRFRNLAYFGVISTLIKNNSFPEDFEWFTKDGKIVKLSETDVLEILKKSASLILEVEKKTINKLKELENIQDLEKLSQFNVSLEE